LEVHAAELDLPPDGVLPGKERVDHGRADHGHPGAGGHFALGVAPAAGEGEIGEREEFRRSAGDLHAEVGVAVRGRGLPVFPELAAHFFRLWEQLPELPHVRERELLSCLDLGRERPELDRVLALYLDSVRYNLAYMPR